MGLRKYFSCSGFTKTDEAFRDIVKVYRYVRTCTIHSGQLGTHPVAIMEAIKCCGEANEVQR